MVVKQATDFEGKLAYLHEQLAEFNVGKIHAFSSASTGYRMRAEFRVWHDGDDLYHVMFNPEDKSKYRVDYLPAACNTINQAMKEVLSYIRGNSILRKKLFQIEYLAGLSEELIISLVYHKPLDESWIEQARQLKEQLSQLFCIDIIGRARKQKICLDRDFIIEVLPVGEKNYIFKHIEGSFTQPNAKINCEMIAWAQAVLGTIGQDLLELYCGAGNFTIPLGDVTRKVFGTEISRSSVNAAQDNIRYNNAENVVISRISAEDFVSALNDGEHSAFFQQHNLDAYHFKTVLVDPPRAGLDRATVNMISQFENIVYISCNPLSLVENLRQLSATHAVTQVAFFDQFPLTPHIETGVHLIRNP